MKEYSNLISMGAMMVAVFFTGAFLSGERHRTKELKMELQEIRAQKDAVMQRVEQINQRTYEEEQKILDRIETAYTLLNSLNSQRTLKRKEIEEIRARIEQTQQDIENNIAVINAQTSEGWGLITPLPDTSQTDSASQVPSS